MTSYPATAAFNFFHKKIRQSWYNPRTLQSGPSVERILKQELTVIPKLSKGMAKDAVAFYKWLQQVLVVYLILLMPFDTICLSNNYEGLFTPGLGTEVYAECWVAVLELLPRPLPTSDLEIQATISAVRNSSHNGYDLLWWVLALYVPGFNPTIPIAQPVWTRNSSILDFSQSHLLYFHLQAKKNTYFTPRDRTNIFLCAIAPSEYADIVTTLQTTVDAYCHPEDDRDLPENLHVICIAMMIHQNSKHRVRDVGIPCIHHTHGSTASWDLSKEDDYGYCHIQGY